LLLLFIALCARFSHCPCATHKIAVKKICRYLKGSFDQGIIITPTRPDAFDIECFCDSDFVGLFRSEDPTDPVCSRSRTDYVVTLAGCTLLWVSKLQTTTALSTMEAEYQALSASCWDLIPLRHIIQEASTAFLHIGKGSVVRSYSKVYEDNSACLSQATTMPKMTPRTTRHIAVAYHWFREYALSGVLQIVKVDTAANLADIFTKGLVADKFTAVRKQFCGW
jgi:hypothetical protein